jgi:hypothetical protein
MEMRPILATSRPRVRRGAGEDAAGEDVTDGAGANLVLLRSNERRERSCEAAEGGWRDVRRPLYVLLYPTHAGRIKARSRLRRRRSSLIGKAT